MNISKPLPLDSPLWDKLGNFELPPSQIPSIIGKLIEGPLAPADQDLNHLMSAIFHQDSLAEATYAVFPYLLDLNRRYEKSDPRIFGLAANIAAAARDARIEVPDIVKRPFEEALFEFEKLAVARLVKFPQPFEEIYGACQAAMAFVGHCSGRLLMDVLEQEGTKRTQVVCPKCQKSFQIALLEHGITILGFAETESPHAPEPLSRPLSFEVPERRPNPWLGVASFLSDRAKTIRGLEGVVLEHWDLAIRICSRGMSSNLPPGAGFTVIGTVLLAHGFVANAHRFFRFWDKVSCPNCQTRFVVADGWWGCAK